jgi:hypothetical protein
MKRIEAEWEEGECTGLQGNGCLVVVLLVGKGGTQ